MADAKNQEEGPIDWVSRSGTRAKGRRPEYFDDPSLDRLYSVVMALVAEVSVLRERNDTLERVLASHGVLSRDEIETYAPDRDAGLERGIATREYIARVMRGFQQEVEAMEAQDPPIMDWVEKLAKD
ncbi:MAG: hypothetical protein ABJP48_13160 [Erythrobacter sp.]